MINNILNMFRMTDLRNRILFTLLMIVIYRLATVIPVPYFDVEFLKNILEKQNDNGLLGILSTFTGGALMHGSIVGIGIMPYITASIITQILSMDTLPLFTRWMKEGESGRRKLNNFTRCFTIALAAIQAPFLIQIIVKTAGASSEGSFLKSDSIWAYVVIVLVIVAGTAFIMWLSEQITEYGISNGISVIIFAGILSSLPGTADNIYTSFFNENEASNVIGSLKLIGLILVVILVTIAVIYVQEGVRRIPVHYTKRVVGRKMYGGRSTHIPLKVNIAGVIPIILAIALLTAPTLVLGMFKDSPVASYIADSLDYNKLGTGTFVYSLLIIAFAFFYAFLQLNPVQLADQMKKNGGFIPGVRPGQATEKHLSTILQRLTLSGALFLVFLSLLPLVLAQVVGLPDSVRIIGTSLLIMVGVALEIMKTIQSQLVRKHHKGFL